MKTWWSNANTHKLTLGAHVISIQLCPFHLVVHPSHTFVLQSAEAIQILQAIATRHCSGQHRWCWATALEATADSQWNIKINQKVLSPTRYMLVFVALWAHKNLRAKFNMAVLKATSAAPCLPWYMCTPMESRDKVPPAPHTSNNRCCHAHKKCRQFCNCLNNLSRGSRTDAQHKHLC